MKADTLLTFAGPTMIVAESSTHYYFSSKRSQSLFPLHAAELAQAVGRAKTPSPF